MSRSDSEIVSDRAASENRRRDKTANEQKRSNSASPVPAGQQRLKTPKTEIQKGN